jgi:asparagine synthase (glutamine-hydrolysing)
VSRLAGVFAPRRQGAPTPERLVEALGASATSASTGPLSVAWTSGFAAQTTPNLAVTARDSPADSVAALESSGGRSVSVGWDAQRGEGFLAVDPLGAASLFLHDDGARLTFASEVADMLRLLSRRPPPNERALVRWLADGSTERADTFYEGIRRLPGGHVVRLSKEGWRTECYWAPRYEGVSAGGAADNALRLREAVTDAVDRTLAGTARPGVLLSGGLDSTTVAAIARRHGPLRSYSAVFPEHAEADESSTIGTIAEVLDLESEQIPWGRASVLEASEQYLRAWKLPPGSPMLAVHQPVLQEVQRNGIDALLDGQGGDELFGESPYVISDRLRGGRIATARRLARIAAPGRPVGRTLLELGVKGSLPRTAHRAVRRIRPQRYAPHWLQPEAARRYAHEVDEWPWKRLDGPRWWAFLADALTAGRERAGIHDYLRHKTALAGADGRHPLLQNLDLIRTVLAIPPELAFDPELDRPLLRLSMAGIVPDIVRLKTEKPHFTRLFVDAVGGRDHAAIAALLEGRAEIYAYVRRPAIERLLRATTQERRAQTWAWTLWRLATCEKWLHLQDHG